MSKIDKKRLNPGWVALIILLALFDFAMLITYLLHGKNVSLLNPKGLIASEQQGLMFYVAAILLLIAIPSLFLAYFIAWKYRESNTKARHTPNPRRSKYLDFFMWGVPTVFMIVISMVMWFATHRLVPQKTIASDAKPLRVQVVSLNWKWLFIYPEQQIATVNYLQLPVDTPVTFELTADRSPMSSFWIPNLGGQLYTMTGHVNRLNLMADTLGDYTGRSAEINGTGFAGMKFTTRVSKTEDFDHWVQKVKQSSNELDTATYENLVSPSENHPQVFYSAFQPDLYDKLLMRYAGSHDHESTEHEARH